MKQPRVSYAGGDDGTRDEEPMSQPRTRTIRYVCRTHPDITLFYGEFEIEAERIVSSVEQVRWCSKCERAYHPWECDLREDDDDAA